MKNVADFYPLSPMQQGMLFHNLVAPDSGVYVEIMSCALKGELNISAFSRSWQRVIDRHSILRTAFVSGELKEPAQVVYHHIALEIHQQDWMGSTPDEQSIRLAEYLETERVQGFDLKSAPLMRLALIRLAEDTWQFVWIYHHILMDGWSTSIVFQEVMGFYNAFAQNRDLHLELPRSFRDYIVWLKRQSLAEAESYWRGRLEGLHAPTPLIAPRSAQEVAGEEERYEEREIWLSAEKTRQLQVMAGKQNITLNTLVCGAWGILLSRYCGEEDICFGVTVSGRPPELPGSEGMVGLFINTLPARMWVDSQQPAQDWLKALQSQLIEMRQYEYSPLVAVQGWSQIPRHQHLFETILVYENFPMKALMSDQETRANLVIEGVDSIEQTNYPLTAVAGADNRLMLKLVYDCRMFDAGWIDRMLGHWALLLENIAAQPASLLGKIGLLTGSERSQILLDWNQNKQDFPSHLCAHELFEIQATRCPEAVAIDFEGEIVTYEDLNGRANRLAHFLIRHGVTAEARVGLCFERSVDMIVAILAVLKAGGTYLPLDPAYPPDRLSFMINDSGIKLLLTCSAIAPTLPAGNIKVITLDKVEWIIAAEQSHNLAMRTAPGNVAYIIYTSGSTGRPKGVLIEHRGLTNLVTQYARAIDIGPGSRMLQFFSYSFDGSVADIFVALTSGAALCIGRRESLMPGLPLAGFLRERRVTHGMVTPSALTVLPAGDFPDLQVLLTGGELCTRGTLEAWDIGCRLVNAYGPTEGTVISTLYEVQDIDAERQNIPIGRPLANTTLYILDPQMNPVPVGIAGEVYIGGAGIARGYLNRPELTAERFIADPFSNIPGARMYRTGDLARFRADGVVDFLGRTDDQVKVRGFRIELGEIEAAMSNHERVAAAVAAALPQPGVEDPSNCYLVAYVVPRAGENITLSEVQAFLRQTLPEYMLPGTLIVLDALPLTPSGKVNRKALPHPEQTTVSNDREYVGPRDEIETQLCQIWEGLLNVRPIGVHDSFFDLGGHSLLAVRMMAQIKEKLGQDVNLLSLFQSPTIEQLADTIRRGSEVGAAVDQIAIANPPGSLPETSEQHDANGRAKILIPLQPHGTNPPMFFVHPSGGSTHWYTEIAAALGKDQPSYAFQARGVDGDLPIHTTIAGMAACYIDALRSIQPNGPYHIGSWSLGVIIAYEMAQQLYAQGEQVAFLAMLDQGPALPYAKPEDNADYLVQTFGKNIPLDIKLLRQLSNEEQIAHVLEIGKKKRFIYPEIKLAEFSHFIRLLQTEVEAWRNYVALPYPGQIDLFKAVKQDHPADLGADLGWGSLALGGVKLHAVPGDHLSMIHKPHVRKLADALKICLNSGERISERGKDNGTKNIVY